MREKEATSGESGQRKSVVEMNERKETKQKKDRETEKREVVRKHVGISGTLRPEQRHENLVRPPYLSTDHIPSPPDFLIQEPYPPGCFGAVVLFTRVYIGKQIT